MHKPIEHTLNIFEHSEDTEQDLFYYLKPDATNNIP